MQILSKINELYGKYLYIVVPSITLIIAIIEVFYEISYGDIMHVLANTSMGVVSLAFFDFYIKSDKQRIGYCLIEIYLFIYTVYLAMDNHFHFIDIVWIVFLPCAIFCLFFVIFFNMKHK